MATNAESLTAIKDHSAGWDWENKHVSASFNNGNAASAQDISVYDIIESGTVLLCAGPADLDKATGSAGIRIVPIGLVETVQINMNKPLSRIFEIGSKLSYIIPGRTVGGISINRVFFDGPSLLKILYAGEVVAEQADTNNKTAQFASSANNPTNKFALIGSGNLAMNLASTFFDMPIGLAFIFKDRGNGQVSQIYFEGCRVGAYNLGISANMNVLTEAINMEFVRCRPIVNKSTAQTAAEGDLVDKNIVYGNPAIPAV